MDKLEVLCRAWIECDPNRKLGAEPGSGSHPDDLMPSRSEEIICDNKGRVIGYAIGGVSDELAGKPYWRWFLPRAVALEAFLEQHGFMIVLADQVGVVGDRT